MVRCLKICVGVFVVLLILFSVTIITLYFTLLKPKQPIMTTEPVMLESVEASLLGQINVTMGINITVYNRNHGSFRYEDSTAYISYRGTDVAEAPIKRDNIPARARHNISTSLTLFANRLASVPGFWFDVLSGVVNFTSSTTLHGHVKVLGIVKAKAKAESTCDVSILLVKQSSEFACRAKVEI